MHWGWVGIVVCQRPRCSRYHVRRDPPAPVRATSGLAIASARSESSRLRAYRRRLGGLGLRNQIIQGESLATAAAVAGMSERSGRRWRKGELPSDKKKHRRRWRTRPDPFAGVWEEQIEPLLRVDKDGVLSANTILEWLDRQDPEGLLHRNLEPCSAGCATGGP